MLPRNAVPLLNARLAGKRPEGAVIVSFVGDTGLEGHHVFADPGTSYDWRFLLDLPTLIAVKAGVDVRAALVGIFDVAQLYPTVIDFDRKHMASVIQNKPLRLWPMTSRHPGWREVFA